MLVGTGGRYGYVECDGGTTLLRARCLTMSIHSLISQDEGTSDPKLYFYTKALMALPTIVKCEDGTVYEGYLKDGLFHGKGQLRTPEGKLFYSGNFRQGQYHGFGRLIFSFGKAKYQGTFQEGRMTGSGRLTQNGYVYQGDIQDGKRHGSGICRWDEGAKGFYDGEWEDDLPHGQGMGHNHEDILYEGQWEYGKLNGIGKLAKVIHDQCGRRTGAVLSDKRFFEDVVLFENCA